VNILNLRCRVLVRGTMVERHTLTQAPPRFHRKDALGIWRRGIGVVLLLSPVAGPRRLLPYRLARILERLLMSTGIFLLALVTTALGHRSILSRAALAEFDQAQAALTQKEGESNLPTQGVDVDVRLWSPKRIREYRQSLFSVLDPPLAVLTLERLGIRAPVFEGTTDLILNRGAGWITGTTRPGAAGNGNVGIAGHRDGFFRGFKDIRVGDTVELSTPGLVSHYVVSGIEIVNPSEVGVLEPRGDSSLTLVTCYPFYFLGDAPKRFIVHATLKGQRAI
jgi:sortase A